jgi:putative transposase
MLQNRLGMSQRRACRAVRQPRSTQRYLSPQPDPDAQLRRWLREFSRQRPRWGYRRAHAQARAAGYAVNRKKIQRLWREEGLRVPTHRRKRQRLGISTVPADRRCPEQPNQVWAADFQFDTTADGRLFKILNLVDEHTREALACHVARRIDADATVTILETVAAGRGYPQFIRCDNGPELTAHAIRDWCGTSGAGTVYIDPGAPWQNPWVESFNARLRDELLAVEQFDTILEAKVLVEDWRIDYNVKRPHSSLGYLAPATYAATWTHPQLS